MQKLIQNIKELKFYETLRHGSVYLFSYLAIQVLMVVSLPIFTKLLTPADFGIYEVFNNTVRVFAILFSLNLFSGYYRFYFEKNIDTKSLMQYLLRTSFIAFFICSLLFLIFSSSILNEINLPKQLAPWIVIAVFSNIILNYFSNYNTAQQESKRAGIWQFISQFLRVIGALFFVFYYAKNYEGRIIGETIFLFFISCLIAVIYFRKYIGWKEEIPNKKEIVSYALNFIPIGLSGFALGYLDTIMINKYNGSNDAGLYSYAYKIATIYSGITAAFLTANRPRLYELMNQKLEEEVIKQMRSMFKILIALASFFIFFSQDAGKILALNKAFYNGLYLLPILILSYIFNDLNDLYSFYINYAKKIKYFYYSFFIAAMVNFILNLILIPKYGYTVAAYTTLISFATMLITTYIICKYVLKLRVPAIVRFIDYICIVLLILLVNYVVNYFVFTWSLQIATKCTIYFFVLLYLWKNIIKRFLSLK